MDGVQAQDVKTEGYREEKRGQSVHRVRFPHMYIDKTIRQRKQRKR
jgi:hypothetical protein